MTEQIIQTDRRAVADEEQAIPLGDLWFPIVPESVHGVRECIGLLFDSWWIPDSENARLCVSELATNVVTHAKVAGSNMRLVVERRRDRVRVEVHDSSTREPEIQPDTRIRESGNGLFLVDACSSDWGFDHTPTGKVVWFELSMWGGT